MAPLFLNIVDTDESQQTQGKFVVKVFANGNGLSDAHLLDISGAVEIVSEDEVRWYLEQYPKKPLLEHARAASVSRTLEAYGSTLAIELQKCSLFKLGNDAPDELVLNVCSVDDISPVQQHHWEVLEDTKLWNHVPKIRKVTVIRSIIPKDEETNHPPLLKAEVKKLKILFVVARRAKNGVSIDRIDPCIITRQAFNVIKKHKYTVEGEILYPPTWNALQNALSSHPRGHYFMVHFDMHGRIDQDSESALLEFQSEGSIAIDAVPARKIADALVSAGINTVNLNACNSAKPCLSQDGNLAYLFARRGIPTTIAMSFDILEDGAEIFEAAFFSEYLTSWNADSAARLGRRAMAQQSKRKAAFKTTVDLNDSFVPVVYSSATKTAEQPASKLKRQSFTKSLWRGISSAASTPINTYRKMRSSALERQISKPSTLLKEDDIIGRSEAIASMERLLTRADKNFIILVGPAGSGKTALLKHAASWWKQSGFVEESFYHRLHKDDKLVRFATELLPMIRLDACGPVGWAKDWDTLWDSIVNGLGKKKALLIIDDANLPICLDPTRSTVLMKNDGLLTSEEVTEYGQTATVLMELLEALAGSNCYVILASRWQPQWMGGDDAYRDDYCYTLPALRTEEAMRLAQNIGRMSKIEKVLEQPGAKEQLLNVIHQVNHNPLAMEVVIPLIFQPNLPYSDALNRLWTEDAGKSSVLGNLRRQHQFAAFLRKHCSKSPPSLTPDINIWSTFWISELLVSPPEDDALFWMWISILLSSKEPEHVQSGLQNQLLDSLHLIPPSTDFENSLDRYKENSNFSASYSILMSKLSNMGILIRAEDSDQPRVHPLFSLITRGGTFGVADKLVLNQLKLLRSHVTWRYSMGRIFNTVKENSSESDVDWSKVIPEVVQFFPDIMHAMEIISRPEILSNTVFGAAFLDDSPVMMVLAAIEKTCIAKEAFWTPYGVIRHRFLERCMRMESEVLEDEHLFYATSEHLQALCSITGLAPNAQALESFETYLSKAYSLIDKRKEKLRGKSSSSLATQIRKLRTTEGLYKTRIGQFEAAEVIFEELLLQEPEYGAQNLRYAHIFRIMHGWITVLSTRVKGFPNPHEMLQRKETIKTIVLQTNARTLEQLNTYCPTALSLLECTLYELRKATQPLSLPPQTSKFDTQYLSVYNDSGGIRQVFGHLRVDLETFNAEDQAKSVEKMSRLMKRHNLASGQEGDVAHIKFSEMALAQHDWVGAIHHLTIFTGGKLSDFPMVHLVYTLCFAKLKLWQAAKDHATRALEIAEQTNNTSLLPVIYGSLAGLIYGKNGHYSALPKMLLLKGLALVYSQEGPFQSHLENRSGVFLGWLLQTVSSQVSALSLGIDPDSIPQFYKKYKSLAEWEDQLDAILITVDRAVEAKLSYRLDGIQYDGGRLRRELTKEAEEILFSLEVPAMPHFGSERWARLFFEDDYRGSYWDMIDINLLSGPQFSSLMEGQKPKSKVQLQYEVPKEVLDNASISSLSSSDDETEGGVKWSRCFHEAFLEDGLIPKQARVTDMARDQTVNLLSALGHRVEERVAGEDDSDDEAWVKKVVDDALANI